METGRSKDGTNTFSVSSDCNVSWWCPCIGKAEPPWLADPTPSPAWRIKKNLVRLPRVIMYIPSLHSQVKATQMTEQGFIGDDTCGYKSKRSRRGGRAELLLHKLALNGDYGGVLLQNVDGNYPKKSS